MLGAVRVYLQERFKRLITARWWLPRLLPTSTEVDLGEGFVVYDCSASSSLILFLSGNRLIFTGERRRHLLKQQGLWVGTMLLQPLAVKAFRKNWRRAYYGDGSGLGISLFGSAQSYVEAASPEALSEEALQVFELLNRLAHRACEQQAKKQAEKLVVLAPADARKKSPSQRFPQLVDD